MDRTVWTDDRLDDLAARSERNSEPLSGEDRSLREETRDEIHGLRDEVHGLRDEARAEGRGLREEMAGWAMAGTLIAAVVALVIGTLA